MKIEKGLVRYGDRTDITCTFMETDSGNLYYFVKPNEETDETKLTNGNRIASTMLVEAIDPSFKSSHVGLIDGEGKEVIPFINRSIKPVEDKYLLVEAAEPKSESVKEALQMKNDPPSATNLISNAALIKERMNPSLGEEGRYLFHDQFSEATLYDIDGNNLMNNEYYSFIGQGNGKLVFSKNDTTSGLVEFELHPEEKAEETVVEAAPAEEVKEEKAPIDVAASEIPTETVEKALTEGAVPVENEVVPIAPPLPEEGMAAVEQDEKIDISDIPAETEEKAEPAAEEAAPETTAEETKAEEGGKTIFVVPPEGHTIEDAVRSMNEIFNGNGTFDFEPDEEAEAEVNPADEIVEVTEETVENTETPATVENPVPVDAPEAVEETVGETDENIVEEAPAEEVVAVEEAPKHAMIEGEEEETPDNVIDEDDHEDVDLDESVEETSLDDLFQHVGEEPVSDYSDDMEEDSFMNPVQIDKIEADADEFADHYEMPGKEDTIISDVVKSMAGLMDQNKELKAALVTTQESLERVTASRKNVVEKANMQVRKIEALSSKVHSLEMAVEKLEGKTHDQERIIAAQDHELKVLRPQVEGKEDLAKLLEDAKALLGEDNYSYSDETYYGKAA